MLHTRVAGGTRAGWKRPPKAQAKQDWECSRCHARNKFYWTNCPNCGAKRED